MATEAQVGSAATPSRQSIGTFLAETRALYVRALRKLIRRPVILYFSLIQPMVWLLLFGQIFNRITRFPGAAEAFGNISYFQFFMPAVVLQTILFGAGQSGIGIINDIDTGFLDKLLTTPINRMAILLGKVLGDLTRMILQSVLIIAITWGVGQFMEPRVTYTHGLVGVIGTLLIALLFGVGLAGLTVFIALRTRNTESTFLISNFLTLPLLFTSSAQLPLQLLPEWLQRVALVNPVTYAIDSMRFLLNGQMSVVAANPLELIAMAVAILLLIAMLTLTLAVRSFRRSVR